MNKTIKVITGTLAATLLISSVSLPAVEVHASIVSSQEESAKQKEFYEAVKKAVLETQYEFEDPTVTNSILSNIEDIERTKQSRGKLTITAKAAAKALKVSMKKIGKKAWDKMVSKIEKTMGVNLVVLHWKGMNKLIDYLADSGDKIEDALTGFLTKHGFNKTFARYLAKAFILVAF